nr:unnamed protein product [Spirometra erinaceieuropaei]
MDVDDFCAKCRKRPTNPHTMVCGHTFCLSPCVQEMKTYRNFVRCPLCRIETDVACLTPRRSVQSSHPENSPVCSGCNRSSPSSKICEHCSRAICPECTSLHQAEMLALLAKKLSALQSKRTALTSLKATLLKLKDNQNSYRETLTREVTSATDRLLSITDCALEKAKLLVISTSNDEQTLSQKLGKDIMHLLERHRCLSKTACDVQGKKASLDMSTPPFGLFYAPTAILTCSRYPVCTMDLKNSAGLKEFELSARTHLDKVKELKKSVKCCETSGISSLAVAKKFETIHLQLQEMRLVTSESIDLPPPQQSKAKKKSSTNPAFMRKTEWDVNPHRIFVGSLPESIKECSLHEYFSEYGIVTDVFLAKGQESRRFGYVAFRDLDSVRKVLDSQPHKMNETPITVSLAKNKRPADSGVSECEKGETASSASEDKKLNNNAATELVSNQLTVFVGQLKSTVSEADLKAYFSKFGTVTEASVIRNKTTGESRGFGFVTFSDKEAFEGGVLEACHFLDGCRLNVKPANPRNVEAEEEAETLKHPRQKTPRPSHRLRLHVEAKQGKPFP